MKNKQNCHCETIPMRRGKAEVESGGEAISLLKSLLRMRRVRLPRRSHPDFIGTRTPRNDISLVFSDSLIEGVRSNIG